MLQIKAATVTAHRAHWAFQSEFAAAYFNLACGGVVGTGQVLVLIVDAAIHQIKPL
jgi:hypothetical protein